MLHACPTNGLLHPWPTNGLLQIARLSLVWFPASAESHAYHAYKVEENDNVTKSDSLYYSRSRKY